MSAPNGALEALKMATKQDRISPVDALDVGALARRGRAGPSWRQAAHARTASDNRQGDAHAEQGEVARLVGKRAGLTDRLPPPCPLRLCRSPSLDWRPPLHGLRLGDRFGFHPAPRSRASSSTTPRRSRSSLRGMRSKRISPRSRMIRRRYNDRREPTQPGGAGVPARLHSFSTDPVAQPWRRCR